MFIVVKLFVLGNPGSGKSTVVRYIAPLLSNYQWSSIHINDYDILKAMFQEDAEKEGKDRQFAASEFDGFDVLRFDVFDAALLRLEQKAVEEIASRKKATTKSLFVLIEFARNDYQRAFRQFTPRFLRDAYFLYLDTSIATCKQRIRKRVAKPLEERTEDDFYVSDYIFDAYYDFDNGKSLPEILEKDFGINKQMIMIVNNNAGLEVITQNIAAFTQLIIGHSLEESILPHRDV